MFATCHVQFSWSRRATHDCEMAKAERVAIACDGRGNKLKLREGSLGWWEALPLREGWASHPWGWDWRSDIRAVKDNWGLMRGFRSCFKWLGWFWSEIIIVWYVYCLSKTFRRGNIKRYCRFVLLMEPVFGPWERWVRITDAGLRTLGVVTLVDRFIGVGWIWFNKIPKKAR